MKHHLDEKDLNHILKLTSIQQKFLQIPLYWATARKNSKIAFK